jgi:hypothetical protein
MRRSNLAIVSAEFASLALAMTNGNSDLFLPVI